jgi:hypothetical protein
MGFDHGTWSVLKPMFPQGRHSGHAAQHGLQPPACRALCAGPAAQGLRERGVLIVGSGNIVHNLRAIRRNVIAMQAYDWAMEFDQGGRGNCSRGDCRAGRFPEAGHSGAAWPTPPGTTTCRCCTRRVRPTPKTHAVLQRQLPERVDLHAVGGLGLTAGPQAVRARTRLLPVSSSTP